MAKLKKPVKVVMELIGLASEILRQRGMIVETADGPANCCGNDEFLIGFCPMDKLALYEIMQHDLGDNVTKLFAAEWPIGADLPNLQVYRAGEWVADFRRSFRKTIKQRALSTRPFPRLDAHDLRSIARRSREFEDLRQICKTLRFAA
jgi:hypothetical protein